MIRDNWRAKYKNLIAEATSPEFATLVELYDTIVKATYKFFEDNELKYIPVPATTISASSPIGPGSDSAPVVIQINDRSVLLTDSAQFHLECACRSFREGCFYCGHSFRDEEPDKRHLSQFSHVEAEILGTLDDVKTLVERYLRYLVEYVWGKAEGCLAGLPGISGRIFSMLNEKSQFRSISFREAIKMLGSHENALRILENGNFIITPAGEMILLEKFGEFLWIERWDIMAVPFYQAIDREQGFALNADLLFGIGEVVGAGQRHTESDDLEQSLNEHGLLTDDYKWYIEMKRQFPLQTAGFGMGIERFLLWLLDLKDIRSVELFPRNRLQGGEI